MKRNAILVITGIAVIGFLLAKKSYALPVDSTINYLRDIMSTWQDVANRPENFAYVTALKQAETDNDIPQNMLIALAYQESHFRQDIISGQTVSPAGAVGIMQIVPKWHPAVNPRDPVASINYAAKFLRSMYDKFGTWELALQAYNWGAGNLSQYLKGNIPSLPNETWNYSTSILSRVAETGVTVV